MFSVRDMRFSLPTGLFLALVCGFSTGCGGDGLHHISGKVTFKGKPLPAGKIYFTPDSSKDSSGPTGYANIKNGEYDTSADGGKGIKPGAMTIAIEGNDPSIPPKLRKGESSEDVTTTTLFARYEIKKEITGSEDSVDFDVPAEAARVKPGDVGERRVDVGP